MKAKNSKMDSLRNSGTGSEFLVCPTEQRCLITSNRHFNRLRTAQTRKQILLPKPFKKITGCHYQNRLAHRNECLVTDGTVESKRTPFWAWVYSIFFNYFSDEFVYKICS